MLVKKISSRSIAIAEIAIKPPRQAPPPEVGKGKNRPASADVAGRKRSQWEAQASKANSSSQLIGMNDPELTAR
jgi:hypothetical protein